MKRPLVFSLGPKGDDTARHIAQLLAAPVHFCGPGRERAAPLVREAYAARSPVIGVCAAGVLVRLVGPDLGERTTEPPVLAVSADGRIAVPLLGVSRGANALARWIAEGFRGLAAVTSLSDTPYDFTLDDPPPGYAVGQPEAVKPVMAALLNGEALCVEGPSGWLEVAGYPVRPEGTQKVVVTEKAAPAAGLLIHPKTLVAGVGAARGAEADEIVALVRASLAEAGLSPLSLAALATLSDKTLHPALPAAAAELGVPLRGFSRRELNAERKRLQTPSETVEAATGLAGVAEAAALKAGALALPKRASAHATCAIGKADFPIDLDLFGTPSAQ